MTTMRARVIAEQLTKPSRDVLDNAEWRPQTTRARAGWRVPNSARRAQLRELLLLDGTYLTPLGEQVREVILENIDAHPRAAAA